MCLPVRIRESKPKNSVGMHTDGKRRSLLLCAESRSIKSFSQLIMDPRYVTCVVIGICSPLRKKSLGVVYLVCVKSAVFSVLSFIPCWSTCFSRACNMEVSCFVVRTMSNVPSAYCMSDVGRTTDHVLRAIPWDAKIPIHVLHDNRKNHDKEIGAEWATLSDPCAYFAYCSVVVRAFGKKSRVEVQRARSHCQSQEGHKHHWLPVAMLPQTSQLSSPQLSV